MDKISKSLSTNSKYMRLSKPLESARVCEAARLVAKGRFSVISFCDGLLTAGCENSSAAANLQLENDSVIREINTKLGQELIKKLRFKLT